mgnify:CR=1 FL=1
MRILLPPSETKDIGGSDSSLAERPIEDSLSEARSEVIDALLRLCEDSEVAAKALKLGPKQLVDIDRNLELLTSATMPAIERYTGVLFDALKADGLPKTEQLMIQSSLFGLIPASTNIPYYRLSWDGKFPELNLKKHWQAAHQDFFDGFDGVLDMRSKSYQQLAPVEAVDSWVVEVLVEYADGSKKPLNHFNKKAKGVFARHASNAQIKSIDQAFEIASQAGQRAEVEGSILTLIVPEGY